jgi:choline dehydrogenase-like flavoprotein
VNSDSDIIVVGCGVAGATAAETAASLGSKVLLLEEHDRVGVPSHCSGHVGVKSMKHLGVSLPSHIIKNQIRGAVFHSPSGQVLHIERQTPVTWVLDRRRRERRSSSVHEPSRPSQPTTTASAYRSQPVRSHKRSVPSSLWIAKVRRQRSRVSTTQANATSRCG